MRPYFILFLIFLFEIFYIVTAHSKNQSQQCTPSFRKYSKSSSSWKTINRAINRALRGNTWECEDETPKELSTPEECARTCTADGPAKTCYYHFTFEYYKTLSGACSLCQPSMNNSFLTSECQCILADGADVSGIITANRMHPGPAIQVCLGDHVIVDATNRVSGNEITIHWHGLYQNGWQHYDGVPFVTQCPITECTTFRYQWTAENTGTFFWHAHSGFHEAEGLDGPLIVREPIEEDPNFNLYDDDNADNIIFISDWLHNSAVDHFPGTTYTNIGQLPDNFLINGKGQWMNTTSGNWTNTPLAVFDVQAGRRYRFRMINSCRLICPVEFTIEDHNVTIIAVDGESVSPREVTTITTFSAERVDFILFANETVKNYWIHLRGLGPCVQRGNEQHAILRYSGAELGNPKLERPVYSSGLPRGLIFNPVNDVCDGTRDDVLCVKDLESADTVHYKILKDEPDYQIYMPYYFHNFDLAELYAPNTFQRFLVPSFKNPLSAVVGGISNINPPSPLISQLNDIPSDVMCSSQNLPSRCANKSVCYCAHVETVPLDAMVELILADVGPVPNLSHPFHLHGYGFHVMGMGLLKDINITKNIPDALRLNRKVYPPKNNRPPTKDTLAVPTNGYTIVRFIADNPGWWLYHCHFLAHLYAGMSLTIRVGEEDDLPATPEGFPKCGNFVPPVLTTTPKARKDTQKPMSNVIKRREENGSIIRKSIIVEY